MDKEGRSDANFTWPDGDPLPAESQVAEYGQYAMFPPELLVLRQRHPWDLPNIVRGDTGTRVFGTDYYQHMMLWAVPAALAGQDLRAFCAPDGLVDQVMQAGKTSPKPH